MRVCVCVLDTYIYCLWSINMGKGTSILLKENCVIAKESHKIHS